MSEASSSSSILDTLIIGEPMSQRQGVKCCPAIREFTDERYIVKILSIPASQVQLDALLLTGAYPTPAHALEYFHSRAEDVLKEVATLERLHAMEGFLPYTRAEIRKAEDGIGYQVYLISPYKRSLERQMQLEPLTHLGAVNLGLDLCAALAICRRAGYLYIDLKPSNVFITPHQGYRIGDLGFVPLNSLKYASYPEQYRSPYTAPEITDAMSTLNNRIDIYALGLILYQIFNNGELPQETDGTVPPPAYADYEMAEIILKACSRNPLNRWADPLQMGQAIVAYMQRNSVDDTPLVPPPVELPPEPAAEEPVPPAEPDETAEPDITDPESTEPDAAEPELTIPESIEEVGAILDSILADICPAEDADDANAAPENAIEMPPMPEEAADIPGPELDLSFMDGASDDETLPTEESAAEIQMESVSDEVQDILARADELISHELPEPAVAPDPIDVPFPAPITLPVETVTETPAEQEVPAQEAALDEDAPEDSGTEATEPVAVAEPSEDTADTTDDSEAEIEVPDEPEPEAAVVIEPEDEEAVTEDFDEIEETLIEDEPSDVEDEDTGEDAETWDEEEAEYRISSYYSDKGLIKSRRRRPKKALITVICCIVLLIALIAAGTLFYQYYYLQPVNAFTVDGSVDSLTAVIDSSIRDELLTVVCTDTYGNSHTLEVLNGRAHFTNLTPSTQYRVELKISGFHRLDGVTSGTFTTADQTEILNFNAVAGPEDGSVILSFTVNGPEADSWTVAYSTADSQESTKHFTGHTVTVTDLDVGKEYLFRLIPNDEQYLIGTWQLRYTAQQIVYAQELAIKSCTNGVLVAVWDIPEGLEGQSWVVRCYNDNGYDQTVTTTEGEAEFTGLDHAYGYTVEVTAVGMTQSSTATVTANPISLNTIKVVSEDRNLLKLNWTYDGTEPAEGWILDYTIDGGSPITVSCPKNSAEIARYPGSKYEIDVRPVGETSYYGKHLTYQVEKPAQFSNFGVTADDMSFYMCLTPKKANWDRFDVPAPDYKTSFKVGVKASFLVELWKSYQKSDDRITVTYVIRTEAGQPVSLNNVDSTWNKLWDKKFCELDIPQMPETAGKYTVEIYFNGQIITKEAFSVT